MTTNVEAVKGYLLDLQNRICRALEAEETSGKTFHLDEWKSEKLGGGGRTCVLEDAETFEKQG